MRKWYRQIFENMRWRYRWNGGCLMYGGHCPGVVKDDKCPGLSLNRNGDMCRYIVIPDWCFRAAIRRRKQ